MRPSNKRSRSKQNRPRTLGNIINRVFDSSGPEGKVRGTPQQIIDKYQLLARDAQLSGDRVAADNFLQHAEHYQRMLNEAQAELAREAESRREQGFGGQSGQHNPQIPPQGNQPRRFEDRDGGDVQQRFERREDRPQGERRDDRRDERQHGERREDRPRDDRRDDRPRDDRPRDDRPRDERREDRPQGERRDDRDRESRMDWLGRRNRRFEGRNRSEGDGARSPEAVVTTEAETMLVETPESRAEHRLEPRPQPEVAGQGTAVAPVEPVPQEQPARGPRAPRATAPRTGEPAAGAEPDAGTETRRPLRRRRAPADDATPSGTPDAAE
jgi:hypothetical protein